MFVSIRTKVREVSVPRFASLSARFQKNTGGRKSSSSQAAPVRFHSSHWGFGWLREYMALAMSAWRWPMLPARLHSARAQRVMNSSSSLASDGLPAR